MNQLKRDHAYFYQVCDNIYKAHTHKHICTHTYTSEEVGGDHWLSHSCKEDSSNEFSIGQSHVTAPDLLCIHIHSIHSITGSMFIILTMHTYWYYNLQAALNMLVISGTCKQS